MTAFSRLALAALFALVPLAAQADATGVWLRENGRVKVRIAPCGGGLCGTIIWLKEADSPARVGQRVFYGMQPDGDGGYSGHAFNPEDGRTYNGTMKASGNSLTTSGCVLGGLICKTVHWSRAN